MKSFLFRFQTVLNVKKTKEEIKKKEFSDILKLLVQEQALLEEYLSEQKELQEFFSSQLCAKLSGLELLNYREYFTALDKAIDFQKQKIQLMNETLEEKRLELVDASKETKIFEKIEERDHKKYLQSVEQEDLKFLDEIAISQRARK